MHFLVKSTSPFSCKHDATPRRPEDFAMEENLKISSFTCGSGSTDTGDSQDIYFYHINHHGSFVMVYVACLRTRTTRNKQQHNNNMICDV